MNLESAGSRVLFIAAVELAHEGLQASVSQLVSLEVTLCDELLVALRTLERTFAGVSAHVGLQVSRLLKLLQTPFKGTNQELDFAFGAFDSLNR